MSSEPKRKLAAIMFTDMVGYTALMQKAELRARELVQNHREIIKPLIEKHAGEVIQYVGDGTFSTFGSAIEAVNCAIEIQRNLKDNEELSLRIGIHVGDVVVEGDEVYGDGVNVASRLEPMAEAGGVCISGRVYDDIRNQEDMETKFLGEKVLKNVDRPVKIYCLAGEGLKAAMPFEDEEKAVVESKEVDEPISKPASKKLLPWAVGAIVVLIALFGLRWFGDREIGQQAIAGENSIAVMYFENLTGDQSLDWIEAGMVEMLTANLGRIEGLDVLSSQRLYDIMRQVSGKESTARKIDRSTATEIARRAGVRMMLLGSVLGTEGRLRLSTQLVEVPTGKLMGAEVLDTGSDGSIFSLVDSLTVRIAGHLGVLQPERPLEANVSYTLTNSLEALRLYVEGVQALNRFTFVRAIEHLEAAVELDSTFAMAYFQLGLARGWLGSEDAQDAFARARDHADKVSERERLVIEADLLQAMEGAKKKQAFEHIVEKYPDEKYAWYHLGELLYHGYWPRASVNAFLRAIELDQYFLLAYIHPIDFYIFTGQIDKARPLLSEALSVDSLNVAIQWLRAELDYIEGKTIEAAEGFERVIRLLGPDSVEPYALVSKVDLAIMEKDFGKAEILINTGRHATPFYSVLFTNYFAGLALFQGKYNLAEVYIQEAAEGAPNSVFQTYEKGLFELFRGRTHDSKLSAQKILTLHDSDMHRYPEVLVLSSHLFFLSALKEDNEKEAQKAVLELESLVVGNENEYDFLYYDALGRFECHKGNEEMGQEHFTRALNSATFTGWDTFISFRHLILDGLMECLELEGAYETLLQRIEELPPAPMVIYWPSASTHALWPRALIRKARTYEELGRTQKAIEAYEELLELWKDADEGIPERRDAIKRLVALKQGS